LTQEFTPDALPSPPTVDRIGEIYTLRWLDRFVQMTVERFDTDRHQNVSAEITVRVLNSPEGEGHITRGRAGLLSTFRTLVDDATDFGGERNSKDDWRVMFKQMANAVLERHRMGEPLINLAEMEPVGQKPYILTPFIYEGNPTVIYGRGGVGKSLFCLYLAILLQTGQDQNRLTAKKSSVIYLDYEADPEESKHRADLISHGIGVSPANVEIHYRHCDVPLASEIDVIQKYANKVNADCIVIDSAIPACGNALDPEIAGNFFRALRSLNTSGRKIASLIIGHTTKAQDNSGGPFGSVQWRNQPRTVWEFKASQQMEQDEIDVQLIHQKVNLGKILAPIGFKIRWGQGVVEFESLDARRHRVFGTDAPLADRIEIQLEDHGAMATDILLGLLSGATENDVMEALVRDSRFVMTNEDSEIWDLSAI